MAGTEQAGSNALCLTSLVRSADSSGASFPARGRITPHGPLLTGWGRGTSSS